MPEVQDVNQEIFGSPFPSKQLGDSNTSWARALHQINIERHDHERTHLARALHDIVLNRLASFAIGKDGMLDSPEFQSLVTQIRQLIGELRPVMLHYGLCPALEELVDEISEPLEGVTIEIQIDPDDGRFAPVIEVHLYRILQYAISNALRHARPSAVRIFGQCAADGVQITVADDGVGFDASHDLEVLLSAQHYGLVRMYERAEIIGGDLWITSCPGDGTRVELHWAP